MFERARPLLGVLSDSEIAKRLEVPQGTIASWRKALGIAKPPRSSRAPEDPELRYPGILARLGIDSDTHIGADYRISRERVRQLRVRYNIPRQQHHMPPEARALLGKVSDVQLAAMYKLPESLVRRIRADAGIPPMAIRTTYETILSEHHARIGVDSDGVLSRELKIPIAQIVAYRQRHSIPPATLSPRCTGFVPHDRDTIARMFQEGATDQQIAKVLNTTASTIGNIRTTELRLFRQAPRPPIDPAKVVEIHRLLDAGRTNWQCAKEVGVNPSTVNDIARKYRKQK